MSGSWLATRMESSPLRERISSHAAPGDALGTSAAPGRPMASRYGRLSAAISAGSMARRKGLDKIRFGATAVAAPFTRGAVSRALAG